ncbi:ComEC/Rec2 family competence protein [Frankia sp. R82]|uniref:ComEC/Rec2 family competence protein n=1 Tax=Frankia sp. R82 TaxID=2950553 RepID=UPI0020436B0B|nr:ComEC/Rec2 family competence protein [Frankia sp. R82]MCM3883970.1 ComEC/Rec2 family competence protein [Frankia sp. R82]
MVAVGLETGLALAERPSPTPQPLDARLIVPAVAAWGGAATSVGTTLPDVVLALAAAVVLAMPLLLVVQRRRCQRRDVLVALAAGPALATVAVAFLAAGLLAGGLETRPGDRGPFADLVGREATVTARAVIADDPRIIATTAGGSESAAGRGAPSFVVPARLERVAAGSVRLRVHARVVLLVHGAAWRDLLPSQHLEVSGRLSPPRRDPTVAGALLVRDTAPRLRGGPNRLQRAAGRLRSGLRTTTSGLPQPRRGLLPALVDGDVSALDDDLRDDFRAAGLTHLTAVSGGNVAIVTATALLLAGRARGGTRSRAALGVGALLAFVVLARPSPSVLRAGVMGLIGLAAFAAGRPRAALAALAASVTVLVLGWPTLAVSVGFALSVQATAGMIILAPGWHSGFARRLHRRIAEPLAVAAAAQLACTPLLAWLGGGISMVAIPANLAAAPAVPAATVLGVLTLLVAAVAPEPARWLAHAADLPCWWLVTVARTAAGLPAATIGWPQGLLGAGTAAAGVVAAAAVLRRRAARRIAAAALAGLLVARCTVVDRIAPWPPPDWRIVACDVGQGDALVLRVAPGQAVLVDAGPDPALLTRCLDDLGVRELPAIILSHLHADHVNGLPGVLGRRRVGAVLVGTLREPAGQWRLVRRWTGQAGVPVRTVTAGSRGQVGAVGWTVLAPRVLLHGTDSDPNNDSLLVSAQVGEVRILLTGDVEAVAQQAVLGALDAAAALRADVLKVPHHGSADQDPGFLRAARARYALVSVGVGNDYGHPAAATLRILRQAGVAIGRTDRDGALAVTAPDGPASGPGGAVAGPETVGAPGRRHEVSVVRRGPRDGS